MAVSVLAFAVMIPLICAWLGLQVNLIFVLAGGGIGAAFMKWRASPSAAPTFTVDQNLNVTQLKFRVKGDSISMASFTLEFNQDVHTLKTLHEVVSEKLHNECEFDLATSYPRRILDPEDDETTLAKANVVQDSIAIVLR